MVLLYANRKYNQFNTIIKCYTLLQVGYLQITQQVSITQRTLQAQPSIYSSSCLPLQTHDPDLQPPLKPQHLLLIPLNILM